MLRNRAVDINFSSLEKGKNNWRQAYKKIGLLAKFIEVWYIGAKHTPITPTPLKPRRMTALVARTGRHQQRYEQGYRLVAGCVPYRYRSDGACNGNFEQILEVLMITSQSGQGLLFPKGGWETDETVEEAACREALEEAGVRGLLQGSLGSWDFKSKRQQGDCSPEGLCRAHMFALAVTEQLDTWPEQHARQRQWFTVAEAIEQCRHDWMRGALDKCISYLSCKPAAFSLSYETSNSTDSISHFSSEFPNED